jgi:peptidyl-dipeptidase Dcp
MAMQVGERLSGARAVEHFAGIVFQRVMERYDGVLCDGHVQIGLMKLGPTAAAGAGSIVYRCRPVWENAWFTQGRIHMSSILLAILAAGVAGEPAAPHSGAPPTHTGTIAMADNPFRQPSTLPYRLPPFDKIKDSDYVPAFEAGMREQREEVAAIARNPHAADFANTIVAFERTGQLLDRVSTVFSNLNSSNTDPEMDKIDTEMTPRLTAHEDSILLDTALFARVDSLYRHRAGLKLDAESLQLLERYHVMFVRAGATLSEGDKAHLR